MHTLVEHELQRLWDAILGGLAHRFQPKPLGVEVERPLPVFGGQRDNDGCQVGAESCFDRHGSSSFTSRFRRLAVRPAELPEIIAARAKLPRSRNRDPSSGVR